MKPKNPSGADGGRSERVPGDSQAKLHRRGTSLPNALVRLMAAMLGAPSKPAKRPSAKKPPQPETVGKQEVEESMPENVKPQEGPEETSQVEGTAGGEESKERPAATAETTEATRRALDNLAMALSEAEAAIQATQEEPRAGEGAVKPEPEPAVEAPPEAPAAEPPPPPPPPVPDALEGTHEMLRILADHFDHALDRMADERRIVIDELQSVVRAARDQSDRALDRIDQDRRMLAEQVAALSAAFDRLQRRIDDLSHYVLASRSPSPIQVEEEEEKAPEESEPAFMPGDQGLVLVISSVPGFQGLMEVQRALSRIPAIEGASVERYFDGEARIVLMLREPITAEHLLETLSQATGQQLQLEESRPEAMRMRVRFRSS